MKIKTNGFDVFASGSVMSMGLEPITFILDEEQPELHVVFRVSFSDDGKQSIDTELTGENELTVVFNNPSDMGFGWTNHQNVGTINGRDFHINFRIDLYGNNKSFRVTYSFLLKESNNG